MVRGVQDDRIDRHTDWRTLKPGPNFDLWLYYVLDRDDGSPKRYTTEMGAAWRLAEKFRMLVCPSLLGNWCAGIFQGVQGTSPHREGDARYAVEGTWSERETAQMAICCAAFRAWVLLGDGTHEYTPGVGWNLVGLSQGG